VRLSCKGQMGATVIDGRYIVRRPLGTGGQADVYEVDDIHEGDVVALKLLKQIPPGGQWAEAQVLRRLADPHILPIRNADVDSGRPYLVTELAMHGSMEDRIAAAGACGLEVDDVLRWIRQACIGVARAHDQRLVHNDLKPGNLFLNAEGECLVGDFGAASLLPVGQLSTVPLGFTPQTVAPEIAASWPSLQGASVLSDVYSLGATAYWMLAARPAHDLTGAQDMAAALAIVATQSPSKLRDVAPHVPQGVSSAIERAMARLPANRFPTTAAFAAELGSRSVPVRRWRRTDEHSGHHACWRGEPRGGGSTYLLCLDDEPNSNKYRITTSHAGSGNRILRGCRLVNPRQAGQAVRSAMKAVS
jgi:serine/threonine protein kinase